MNHHSRQSWKSLCSLPLLDTTFSRRAFVQVGLTSTAVSFFTCGAGWTMGTAADDTFELPFRFQGVPPSGDDVVTVPNGYVAKCLYAWGDPINGTSPVFEPDASNTAEEQALQAGMGHDGMQWFPFPGGPRERSDRGLLALNHEYTDQGLLFTDGIAGEMTLEKVRKSQAAHGVSIIAVERLRSGEWKVIPSRYTRRYTANSPMQLTGPAAGSRLVSTSDDPDGRMVLGTLNNCACGMTPWGTYLTCEENFHGVFGTNAEEFEPTADQKRYGLSARGFVGTIDENEVSVFRWWEQDERFDLAKHPHEANRFGYVVEIDPADPSFIPRKHTALGRLKHENAAVTVARDGRVVVYMGDDERNEYIYKFVTSKAWNSDDRQVNRSLLDEGTLYVARYNTDGTGEWLELTFGKNGLTGENGFASQADICVRTRQAADRAGGTMMDRPEWVAVHPVTQDVFVTLTNNTQRGQAPSSVNNPDGTTEAGSSRPPVHAANPRADNVYGHILKWAEDQNDPLATSFRWELFLLAGDPQQDEQVSIQGDAFGSPDGLWFDPRGILWIQTDASRAFQGQPAYRHLGNNMMLAADPVTRTVRRFLTGPVGCEITGMTMTPDFTTMFVNIQHPGEPESDISDPVNPTALSRWPGGRAAGRPRSATVVITRIDGGVIGV